ncbi:MAG: hypothetical protein L0227_17065 [Chloroflexi bacterium]|nr:hypothetical protein [Chloroflexota bacterium]
MFRWVSAAAAVLLLMAACSTGATPSPTASPEPSPTPSPSASPTPTVTPSPEPASGVLVVSEAAVAYIDALTAFELAELPASLETQLATEMAAALGSDPVGSEAILGYAARSVASSGTPLGLILVLEFESGWTSLPGVGEGFATGLASGSPVTETTLAARAAYLVETELPVLAFLQGNFAVAVFGSDEPSITEVGEALIIANH